MTIIVILKFIHFLSILLAGGNAVGSVVIQRTHMAAGEPPSAPTAKAMRNMGLIGLLAIALLWITGVWLVIQLYGGWQVHSLWWANAAFYAKLVGATLIAAVSVFANLHMAAAGRANRPPNAPLMGRLAILGRVGLFLALAGAAVAFSAG